MQGAEESRQDWLTRQWRKYVKYGEMINETSNPDVRVLVAATQAGQFGSVNSVYCELYFLLRMHQNAGHLTALPNMMD